MLFGGLIVEKYLTAFSENNNALMTAIFYNTTGSNIGLLFISTGILGFLSCIYCLLTFMKNSRSDYRVLKKWENIKKES